VISLLLLCRSGSDNICTKSCLHRTKSRMEFNKISNDYQNRLSLYLMKEVALEAKTLSRGEYIRIRHVKRKFIEQPGHRTDTNALRTNQHRVAP
jgi:hypothetical protein